jgi:hypothetical protein
MDDKLRENDFCVCVMEDENRKSQSSPPFRPDYTLRKLSYIYIYIYIYTQQDATLQFILSENFSTCFGCYLHPSSGAQTTVFTASGICQTVTATFRYSDR